MIARPWLKGVLEFLKLLRVDPYLFCVAFQMAIRSAPNGQLVQDKICMNWYNTSGQYCHDLPTTEEQDEGNGHFKTRILEDTALFATYNTYITTIPAILWALFAGAWIDRYWRGRKLLMLMGVVAGILENLILMYSSLQWKTSVYYILLVQVPQIFLGGQITRTIAFNQYISTTTPPKLMAIRFMFVDIVWNVAWTIGQALGGYLLVQTSYFKHGEIRNYTICFIVALVVEVLAFIWVWLMIDNRVDRKRQIIVENNGIQKKDGTDNKLKLNMSGEDQDIHPIRLLLDFENIKSMFRILIKKRPNKLRMQMLLLYLSHTIWVINYTSSGAISGQFSQQVYLWSPDWSAYVGSIGQVIHMLSILTVVPFLVKVIKMIDVHLAIIGFTVVFSVYVIKGSWLNEIASYVCIPIGAIGSLAFIGTRTYVSKIFKKDELGKVMSLMSALDTLAPMFTTPIMVLIFTHTLDTYPGTVYQVIALLLLIPIVVLMWIDIYTERPLVEGEGTQLKQNVDENHNNDIQEDAKNVNYQVENEQQQG